MLGVGRGFDSLTPAVKIVEKLLTTAAGWKHIKRRSNIKDLRKGVWNMLFLYRMGALRS
jgi:hypothetical protein